MEPGITNQHVLGSADVQEEMAEDGTRGQAGLDKAVAWLRAVQYPLPFFLQHDEMVLHQLLFWWSVVCLCSVKLWCVCVLFNRSDAAKDWEEVVLQGIWHWDVQLGHSKWQRAALQRWSCWRGW